ncbi:MAG: protein kinase [Pirellulaceae bacterium]
MFQRADYTSAETVELKIEGYEICRKLGEGGMGVVYEGIQNSLDRRVAIKVLHAQMAQDVDFVSRFDRETAVLVRLAHHANVVKIIDKGRSGDHLYFIMEYVEGDAEGKPADLRRLIDSGRLDPPTTRRLILQVADALYHAHQQGVVHRDIKPENILVDRHGHAKVTDFGISSMAADKQPRQLTLERSAMGTMYYMAPEQQEDAGAVDERADIYATGVMLYEMLTGRRPLGAYKRPSELVSNLDPRWDEIVERALQHDRNERLGSMTELAMLIESIGSPDGSDYTATYPNGGLTSPRTNETRTGQQVGETTLVRSCPECGNEIKEEEQYCPSCGYSLQINCPRCGKTALVGRKFCASCGIDMQRVRLFDEHVALGKRHAEAAESGDVPADRLKHAEQAGLALARALRYVPADEEVRGLLEKNNRLASELAWNAADQAYQEKRLSETVDLCEQVLEYTPDHSAAIERIKKIRERRDMVVSRSEHLLEEGKPKAAIELLNRAAQAFEGDSVIADQLAKCQEKRASLTDVVYGKIPKLERDNRWCEISRILTELSESGVRVKGFEDYAAKVEQRCSEAGSLVESGQKLLQSGQVADALQHARQALDKVSDHTDAEVLLREATQRLDESNTKQSALEQAVAEQAWFQAGKHLLSLQFDGVDSRCLGQLVPQTVEGMRRARAYLYLLVWTSLGMCLLLVADKFSAILVKGLQLLLAAPFVQGYQDVLGWPIKIGVHFLCVATVPILLLFFARKLPVVRASAWMLTAVIGGALAGAALSLPTWYPDETPSNSFDTADPRLNSCPLAVHSLRNLEDEQTDIARDSSAVSRLAMPLGALGLMAVTGCLIGYGIANGAYHLLGRPGWTAPWSAVLAGGYAAVIGLLSCMLCWLCMGKVGTGEAHTGLAVDAAAGLMLCGLLAVGGIATHWPRLLIVPLAGLLAGVLNTGAAQGHVVQGNMDWFMMNRMLLDVPILAFGACLVLDRRDPGSLTRAAILALATSGLSYLMMSWNTSLTLHLLLPIWLMVCGGIVAREAPRLDFRLHVRDRMRLREIA